MSVSAQKHFQKVPWKTLECEKLFSIGVSVNFSPKTLKTVLARVKTQHTLKARRSRCIVKRKSYRTNCSKSAYEQHNVTRAETY